MTAEDAIRDRAPAPGRRPRCRSRTPSRACACARRSTGASTSRPSASSSACCRRDPAGVYGRMDFLSRDRQRQAVEELAARTGEAQVQRGPAGDRKRAPGGRARIAGRPRRARRLSTWLVAGRRGLRARRRVSAAGRAACPAASCCRTPRSLYLGSIAALTAAALAGRVRALPGIGGSPAPTVAALALLLLPGARPRDRARPAARRLAGRAASAAAPRLPPGHRSRRRPHDGDRADAARRAPARSTSAAGAPGGAGARQSRSAHPLRHPQRLRRCRHRRRARTTTRFSPPRRAGIDELNRRFGDGHADRFFLFHRERRWNPRERVWMGWERKRGKIEEFNRLLRGATDTSFTTQVGELDILPLGPLLHHARLRHACCRATPRSRSSASSRTR